jgi:hypothetical protein
LRAERLRPDRCREPLQDAGVLLENQKSYKHYRWSGEHARAQHLLLQIAEVGSSPCEGADCNKARFLVQPVETPVLAGATATFFTTVNGPWPLQWYKNDAAIPGATKASFTTDPVTAANANDTYAVEIVGCEKSVAVKAVIFTPSATKSIGVSLRGGGANGTPTLMSSNDIAGVHLQAYWNNAANAGTGTIPDLNVDPPVILSASVQDSDGNPRRCRSNSRVPGFGQDGGAPPPA